MKRVRLFIPFAILLIVAMLGGSEVWSQISQTFTSNGTFTVPAGVTSITVEAWGGGGGGGGSSAAATSGGGGGGGGAYARSILTVTPGATYAITAGSAGTAGTSAGGNGAAGGTSSFGALVSAAGGTGGTGTTTATPGIQGLGGTAVTGTNTFTGGNGANGTTALSGGGGSSAGNAAIGNNATGSTAGAAPTGGGAGGGGRTSNGAGSAGTAPGGGGGAGLRLTGATARAGGAGGAGQVTVSYSCPTCYCTPASTDCTGGDIITNVALGTLNNTTTCGTNGYTDYTGTIAAVALFTGSTNAMSVTVGNGGTEYVSVWIDYNQNGIFESSEFTALGSANGATIAGNISVPAGATPGNTRMRVRVRYNTALTGTDACLGYTYGETEDYIVTINAPSGCTGTPAVAVASGPANFCGGSATLSATNLASGVTGITYQWQSRPTGGSTFTNITGATTVPYTAAQSGATDYQLVVTCANSGLSSVSNIISVAAGPQVAGTTAGSRCGPGTVALSATGTAGTILNWYAAATGGTALGTGSSFNTPAISSTTNFYVGAALASMGNVGQVSDIAANLSSLGGFGMYFATTNAATINTVDIYPSTAGTLNVTLRNAATTTVATQTFTITAADISTTVKKTLALNFSIPAGTTGWSIFYDLSINRGGGTYTYPSTLNGFSITGNTIDGNNITSGTRYYFYNWNVTTISCESVRTSVAAAVTAPPAVTVTPATTSVCGPTAVTLNASSSNAGYSYTYSPGSLSGPSQTVTPAATTTYTVSAVDAATGCNTTGTATVTVNPAAPAITLTPASTAITCGSPATLVTVGNNTVTNSVILAENFNAATNSWTKINNSVGGTPALAAWTLQPDGYVYSSTFHSNDASQFYITNSDAQGSGGTTSTILQSPAFSTAGYTTTAVNFYHYFYDATSTLQTGKVEASTDGTTWTTLQTYTGATTIGTSTAFASATVTLTAPFLNQPVVYVRFKYDGAYRYYWAIDNVSVSGNLSAGVTFASTAGLYTDAAATIPYTGAAATSVYARPSNTITYTATATVGSCTSTATSAFTVSGSSTALVPATDVNTATLGGTTDYRNAACQLIATVAPAGASPVTGNVTSKAYVAGSTQVYSGQPYVGRSYEVTPTANASTATANITLYFTQAELNNYNTNTTVIGLGLPLLPTGPSDASGISNARITQYHGANTNPYAGTPIAGQSIIITPASMVWDATNSWWAVTFPVTGFSGFILHTVPSAPLPVVIADISARNNGSTNVVNWKTSVETSIQSFEVQRSSNGSDFSTFATVTPKGAGSYAATDDRAVNGINYYRVRNAGLSGNNSYSKTVTAVMSGGRAFASVSPNPVTDVLTVRTQAYGAGTATLRDVSGRIISVLALDASGMATFNVAGLAGGMYTVTVTGNGNTDVLKVSKQ